MPQKASTFPLGLFKRTALALLLKIQGQDFKYSYKSITELINIFSTTKDVKMQEDAGSILLRIISQFPLVLVPKDSAILRNKMLVFINDKQNTNNDAKSNAIYIIGYLASHFDKQEQNLFQQEFKFLLECDNAKLRSAAEFIYCYNGWHPKDLSSFDTLISVIEKENNAEVQKRASMIFVDCSRDNKISSHELSRLLAILCDYKRGLNLRRDLAKSLFVVVSNGSVISLPDISKKIEDLVLNEKDLPILTSIIDTLALVVDRQKYELSSACINKLTSLINLNNVFSKCIYNKSAMQILKDATENGQILPVEMIKKIETVKTQELIENIDSIKEEGYTDISAMDEFIFEMSKIDKETAKQLELVTSQGKNIKYLDDVKDDIVGHLYRSNIDEEIKLSIVKALKHIVRDNKIDISVEEICNLIVANEDLNIKSELVYILGYKIQIDPNCLANDDYLILADSHYWYDEQDISYISTQLFQEFEEFIVTPALGRQREESLEDVLTKKHSNIFSTYKQERRCILIPL